MKRSLLFFILFSACSDSVSESDLSQICDGSDELVLVIRDDSNSHGLFPKAMIFAENGLPFVHLNGKCEFWLGGYDSQKTSNDTFNHQTVKHGKLTKKEGLELLRILRFSTWEELDNTEISSFGAGGDSRLSFSSSSVNFEFSVQALQGGDTLRHSFREGFHSALDYLEKISTPIEHGSLRVHILPGVPSTDPIWHERYGPIFKTNWLPLIGVEQISNNQIPICFGESFLVTDNSADVLRAERAKFREKIGGRMILEQENVNYELFVRDTLRYENENGLILFQGEVGPIVCLKSDP